VPWSQEKGVFISSIWESPGSPGFTIARLILSPGDIMRRLLEKLRRFFSKVVIVNTAGKKRLGSHLTRSEDHNVVRCSDKRRNHHCDPARLPRSHGGHDARKRTPGICRTHAPGPALRSVRHQVSVEFRAPGPSCHRETGKSRRDPVRPFFPDKICRSYFFHGGIYQTLCHLRHGRRGSPGGRETINPVRLWPRLHLPGKDRPAVVKKNNAGGRGPAGQRQGPALTRLEHERQEEQEIQGKGNCRDNPKRPVVDLPKANRIL